MSDHTPAPGFSWDHVAEGEQLPSVSMPIDMHRLVLAAAGGRDLSPLHYDIEFARAGGNETAFANTTFQMAFANRVIDDWTGGAGRVRRLKIRMSAPIYLGAVMFSRASVAETWGEGAEHFARVDMTLETETGPCAAIELLVSG